MHMLTFFVIAVPPSAPSLLFFPFLFPIPGMTCASWEPILPSHPRSPLLPQVSGLGAGGSPRRATPFQLTSCCLAQMMVLAQISHTPMGQWGLTIRSLSPAAAFEPAKLRQSWGVQRPKPCLAANSPPQERDFIYAQIKSGHVGPLRTEALLGFLPPSLRNGGGSVQEQDLHSWGRTRVDKECLCECKSPSGTPGCPPTSSCVQLSSTCVWG